MAGGRTLNTSGIGAPASAKAKLHRPKEAAPARVHGPRFLLIITTLALVVFGLVMVYSASFVEAFTNPDYNQDSTYIFRRQLLLTGVGLVALAVTTVIDYRVWNSIASWIPWGIAVILLVLTLTMGNDALGGKRWFDLFGKFNLQPSEFAKIALLLLAGALLMQLRGGTGASATTTRVQIATAALAVGLPVLLILIQPDLGTTLIIFAGIVAVAWFGELSMKPLLICLLLIAVIGAAAVVFAGFRMGRIDAWLDPWAYASDGGYQIINSFYALAGGGVSGVGLGMSHQKYLYLPQSHNDLIFPIIGEEFGLVGTISVVVLFLLFLFAAYRIAHNAGDLYGRVVAGAAATMIGSQAFLNMLCMVNLLPMTGKPLPFFSAGGSSIISTLMLVGLILNVSLRCEGERASDRRDRLLILEGGRTGTGAHGAVPGASVAPAASYGRPVSHSAGRQPLSGKAPAGTVAGMFGRGMLRRSGEAASPMPGKASARAVGKTPGRPWLRVFGKAPAPTAASTAASATAAPRRAATARQYPARHTKHHTAPVAQQRLRPANPLLSLSPARREEHRREPMPRELSSAPSSPSAKLSSARATVPKRAADVRATAPKRAADARAAASKRAVAAKRTTPRRAAPRRAAASAKPVPAVPGRPRR